jgi:hypothetical protein
MLFSPYYRFKILKAFYRKDLQTFEKYLHKIEPSDPLFAAFCRLYVRQQLKADVDPSEWKEWIDSTKSSHHYLRGRAYMEWVTSYLRQGQRVEALSAFHAKCKSMGFSSSDIYACVGLINSMLKENALVEANKFKDFIKIQIAGKSFEESIQLKLSEVFLRLEQSPGNHWKQAFKNFETTDLYQKDRKYFDELHQTFLNIEKKYPLFLNIRTDENQNNKFKNLVIEKIKAGKPFGMIRLGDGESYGLGPESVSPFLFKSDMKSREMKWWGEHLNPHLHEKLRAQFQETLYQSDIIGIPSIYRFFRDFFKVGLLNRLGLSVLSQTTQRGLKIVMDRVKKDVESNRYLPGACFVEHRCHQLLLDKEGVEELAKHATKVLFVTQYPAETLKKVFSGFEMDFVQIPAERQKENSLPFHMDELIEQVRSKTQPGTLAMIASGFAGKYFIKVAKDAGGMALDAGAMSDYWIGKKTRSVFDLI